MTKLDAVKRMLDKASDRYGDNHPITEALARQYNRLATEMNKAEAAADESALTD